MKKLLSSIFVALTLTSSSYALEDIQACFNQFNAGNYQKAVQYGQKAVREYPSNPFAYTCLGTAYVQTGQIDKAIESFKKASEHTSDDHLLMSIYGMLGMEYEAKGDYSNALFYDDKSLKLAERFGDVGTEEANLNNMADIFRNEGNNSKALEYYKKVLELENGKPKSGTIYNNIANIYSDMHNYKKAIEYYKKAINVDEENGHYLDSGKSMIKLGGVYLLMKDFKDAKLYFDKGLERVKKVGNKHWEAAGYGYLGFYYIDIGNTAQAKKYLTKAYSIFKSIGENRGASMTMHVLSLIK